MRTQYKHGNKTERFALPKHTRAKQKYYPHRHRRKADTKQISTYPTARERSKQHGSPTTNAGAKQETCEKLPPPPRGSEATRARRKRNAPTFSFPSSFVRIKRTLISPTHRNKENYPHKKARHNTQQLRNSNHVICKKRDISDSVKSPKYRVFAFKSPRGDRRAVEVRKRARIKRAKTSSYSNPTSLPATAACATINGLINIVRPVGLP